MAKKTALFNREDFQINKPPVIETATEESVVPAPIKPTPSPKEKEPARKAMPLYLTPAQYAYLSYKARRSKTTMVQLLRTLIDADMSDNPEIVRLSKDFI